VGTFEWPPTYGGSILKPLVGMATFYRPVCLQMAGSASSQPRQ
jgi:hypothetical protein